MYTAQLPACKSESCFSFLNTPVSVCHAGVPPQELITSRNFFAKEAPYVAWGSAFVTPMIVPRLLGHRNVHLICWSDAYLFHIPVVVQALVGQPDAPALGAPRACLEHMRVTVFDPHRLISKRKDLNAMKSWGVVSHFMIHEAAKLGVTMEFRVIYPDAKNLAVFKDVQPREDEAVVVILLFVMLRSSEDPIAGGGSRIHLMEVS